MCRTEHPLLWLMFLSLTAYHFSDSYASPAGSWVHVPSFNPRVNHSTIYDPVADRIIAFGGFDGQVERNDIWELRFPLTGTPVWSKLDVIGGPSIRSGHTAVYDPLNQRMLVFGGFSGPEPMKNDLWALSLQGAPTWIQLFPTATPGGFPAALYLHTAVYDNRRHRMVVFGGLSAGIVSNAVFFLDIASLQWSRGPQFGPARQSHAAVYDSLADYMLIFGSDNGTAVQNTTWELTFSGSNPGWRQLSLTPSPGARSGPGGVLDRVRREFVIFGGASDGSVFQDVWRLPLDPQPGGWQLAPLTFSINRKQLAAAYDYRRSRMVIGGGWEGFSSLQPPYDGIYRGDAWALALAATPTWSSLIEQPRPGAWLAEHSLVYGFARDIAVLFGGIAAGGQLAPNDTYALNPATDVWEKWAPSGTPPAPRYDHSGIYDDAGDRMIIFGGTNGLMSNDEVWQLGTGTRTWSRLFPNGPSPGARTGHTAVYDDDAAFAYPRMLVFGGQSGGVLRNDVWVLDLTAPLTWHQLQITGPLPPPRRDHTAVYDRPSNRMVVFGGLDSTLVHFLDDLWILDLNTNSWTQLTLSPSPPARANLHYSRKAVNAKTSAW